MPSSGLPFRFTDERHMKFVELYSREPCLWNRRPYLYGARNAAYKRIQLGINAEAERSEIPMTLQGVKTKIKNMRTGYHQELKKIRANPSYTPKIAWFAPLHQFLAQFLDKTKLEEEEVSSPIKPLKRLQIKLPRLKPIKLLPLESDDLPEIKKEPEPEQQVVIPITTLPLTTLTPPPPLRLITPPAVQTVQAPAPGSPAALQPTQMIDISTLPRTKALQAMSDDEFTYFGLSVAAQLRSMPLSNAMIMQSRIQHMLSTERRRIGGDTTEVNMY